MFSEVTKALLSASRELAETRLKLDREKGKVENLEKIHYRFPTKVKPKCQELSDLLSTDSKTWTESDIARAAMYIGMKELESVCKKDKTVARSLMQLLSIKSKLFK